MKPFKWTPEQIKLLVPGATVTYFVGPHGDAGTIEVMRVGTHPSAQFEGDFIFDRWSGNMPLGACDPSTIKIPAQNSWAAGGFTWTADELAHAVTRAKQVNVIGVGLVEIDKVQFHTFVNKWRVAAKNGKIYAIEDCNPESMEPALNHDPVVLLPVPEKPASRELAQKYIQQAEEKMALARALERLETLFATESPDFSVVCQEDRDAWALVRDRIIKGGE